MLSGIIIDDGYTEDHTIPGVEGHYPTLKMQIRPFTALEVVTHQEQTSKLKNADAREYIAKVTAPRILIWDLIDHKGNKIPVSPDMVCKVKPNLFNCILSAFVGDIEQKTNDAKN